MEKTKITLWKKPPYIEFSQERFEASMTEFKVNAKKSIVLVIPGGGYCCKAPHEGEPIAERFNERGINACVLDYSVAPCHKFAPLADVQRAVRILRSMGYRKIATLGFSAGGHLCCTSATLYNFRAYEPTDEIDRLSAKPSAWIPCYPVVSFGKYTHLGSRQALLGNEWEDKSLINLFSNEKHIKKSTPPCFIWHTADDDCVPVQNSIDLATALSKKKVYFELHIYPHGCHGLGLALDKDDISSWSDEAVLFLKKLNF